MDLRLHFLEAAGDLSCWKGIIRTQIEALRLKIEKIVPTKDHNIAIDILIGNDPTNIIPEIGVGGNCYKTELISISIDSLNENFAAKLSDGHFSQAIAHELHHAMRWARHGYGETLGEAIISEGLADYFSTLITSMPVPPWCKVATTNQIINLAKDQLRNENYNHYEWIFGTGDLPRWAGYSIGYQLIDLYSRKNDKKSKTGMVDIDAMEILNHINLLLKQ
ncbi:DUF2268 domain-containing protein [Bartonella sp. HY329]|uniref:DUF2268 domain-containing protein n=1 Tax=unclassified Bartonella TaxID=2645622 RepID=UPI0021CAAC0A|nr:MULTISPECIES: DUF2268 domain-containing protein [unclassified Bartonella]UXM93949.1 DUF2268 domain-containing protein [Bartonella sp. HY329]UXN08270.1 DUF2268 domain-containing protein [Bartonella sp. HY328]